MTQYTTTWNMTADQAIAISSTNQYTSLARVVDGSSNPVTWLTFNPIAGPSEVDWVTTFYCFSALPQVLKNGAVVKQGSSPYQINLSNWYQWDGISWTQMSNPPPGQNKPDAGTVGLYCSPNVSTSTVTFGLSAAPAGSTSITPICADIVFAGQFALYTPLTTIYAVIGKTYTSSTVIANIGTSWSKFVFPGTQIACSIGSMSPPTWSNSPPLHSGFFPQRSELGLGYKYNQNGQKIIVGITNGTKHSIDFNGEKFEAGGSSIIPFINNKKFVDGDLQHRQSYIILQHTLKGPYTLVDHNYEVVGTFTGVPQKNLLAKIQLAKNLDELTNADIQNLVTQKAGKSYIQNNSPSFAGHIHGSDYELTWVNMVKFQDGTEGSLNIHLHEDLGNPELLSGGGSWVTGNPEGVQYQTYNQQAAIPALQSCCDWINEHYENVGKEKVHL